jgi:peptide/nickel transport system ATP-binding protein
MSTKPEPSTKPEAAPAEPAATERPDGDTATPLLKLDNLKTYFPLRGTFLDRLIGRESGWIKAVDGVSLDVKRGEVVGIVGESGSGKSTLGRTLLGLAPATSGAVTFDGQNVAGLGEPQLRRLRLRMQLVFQDPHASLNPAMDLRTAIADPLKIHGITRDPDELDRKVREILEVVGLSPPERFLDNYPGELSGGQKQRAVLARALILNPDLLVLDEPVSMLDMSVRAKILSLLGRLKDQLGLTYVYITHDLATAKFFCDRIAIMYLGRVVETGPPSAIYDDPKHPYTKALLRAIPDPDPARSVPRDLPRGEVPDAVNPPLGCSFHPRCSMAYGPCGWEGRDLRELLERRWTRLPEEQYERERALIGDLAQVDTPASSVEVPAGKGCHGRDVVELLETVRADAPDDPFWRGVRDIQAADGHARVEFQPAHDPALKQQGRVQVACHLWDPELAPDDGPGAR